MDLPAVALDRRNLLGALAAAAAGSAMARPAMAQIGLGRRQPAPLRHDAVQSLIDAYVKEGRVPGAVVALVEPGAHRPVFLTAGVTQFGGSETVSPDTLWRIYSMSKPITAWAVMQRVAAGDLRLDQPIAEILPEFARMSVAIDPTKGLEARPTDRPITVRHLLTHTAGFTYAINGNGPLEREYRRLGIQPGSVPGFLQPGDGPLPDLQAMTAYLAGLPLALEPGTAWKYSVSLDVAGALLERLTGQTLDRILDQQLFSPLGMASSGFWARDASRLAANYFWADLETGKPTGTPTPVMPREKDGFISRPTLLSGGGGLVSSARDYARFAQMVLDGGEFGGRRVVPPGTAQLALSNLLPPGLFFEGRQGYGAGGRLTLFDTRSRDASGPNGSPALSYGWSGAAGTLFLVDRVRQFAMVAMLQFMPSARFPFGTDMGVALARDADGR
ncbi:serine hydrolase domain-containing protein [Sandarakinorhabdus rubra]|uniref:serine hydrolase domain-containing protein n=1 Tax=Sandarakinorhabdus rubra TaxID=2672568 RepID=UPI0013D9F04E|nr:serine hydrolase domain-containing protein [Sandarakinorhabdus rubra]